MPPIPGVVPDADTLRNSLKEMNLGAMSSRAVENRVRNAREEHRKSASGGRADEGEEAIVAARHSLKKVG